MRQENLTSLVYQLIPIVHEAGKAIMAIYLSGKKNTSLKADQSPVTAADFAAHQYLTNTLKTLIPNCPVVSEEDEESLSHRNSDGQFWLIDPLDGTKEFLAGNSEFTVNVALIEQGRSILGMVYAPALKRLYWGGSELGAYQILSTLAEPIRVRSRANEINEVCRVVASKSHLNAETQSFINRLGNVRLIQAGSSLKFCLVAEGAADVYPRLSPTSEWDTAAAQAVLEGAGGSVLDLNGQPLRYGKPEIINPSFLALSDTTWTSI
ncbi:3'(2'),5'-bisphosphate nucleotidase CysQ [Neisseriaceae bacterium TC5R-5]|nr:3'(2'),5'-bisphosphate nucleotidase CysQ [Neisseriaceae bacterium TC5R-5]